MEKFKSSTLRDLQDFIHKEYIRLPGRFRLEGTHKDCNAAEMHAVANFNAVITILGQMGALKEGALETCIPQIEQRTEQTVWEEM